MELNYLVTKSVFTSKIDQIKSVVLDYSELKLKIFHLNSALWANFLYRVKNFDVQIRRKK